MLKLKSLLLTVSLILFALLSNPVFGEEVPFHQSFHDLVYKFSASGTKAINIATHDQRPNVVSGENTPDFLGVGRPYGASRRVLTVSGKPLADDLTQSVGASLAKNGFKCKAVNTVYSDSLDTVLERLKTSPGEISILLTLDEMRSDTIRQSRLMYDLHLNVYDKTGVLIGENRVLGEEILQSKKLLTPVISAEKNVPKAYKTIIEQLFNHPDIIQALQ